MFLLREIRLKYTITWRHYKL